MSVAAFKSTVNESLQRPEAAGFRTAILSAFKPEGGKLAFTIDVKRIHAVIKRTVQCFYVHEKGVRLPDTHEVGAFSDEVFQHDSPEEVREFEETFVTPLPRQQPKVIADGQFAYSAIHLPRPFTSVWGLLFYGSLPYVVLTGAKKGDPAK